MPNYNFLNLSGYEFEELSRDLLQAHLKITFQSFADGKDQGVDFLYKDKSEFIIVQCKRFETYSTLISALKKETVKIKKQSPRKYILTTTVKLTLNNKEEIKKIFAPWILDTADIFGQKDLNNLLGLNPEIEKQHFKLWLSSTNVLNKILNAKVVNQSNFELETIHNDLKLYVKNNSFYEAVKILKENKFVIISGIPGIGKTTLARMLVCYYLGRGYKEFVYIAQNIDEASSFYKEDVKQIFFYDDFLGRVNLIETGTQHNDLLNFIQHIKRKSNKILIFTTREYILKQAKQIVERYKELRSGDKIILELQKYTEEAKGRILYNHLFFSAMNIQYFKNIIQDKNYNKIISHKNYNPRIIQYITTFDTFSKIKPQDFVNKFVDFLNYPKEIWEHAYKYQIKDLSRIILSQLALLYNYNPILLSNLESCVEYYCRNEIIKFDHDYFLNCTHELENSFVSITEDSKNNLLIQFQNPSIQDYMNKKLSSDDYLVNKLITNAIYFEQLTLNISRQSKNLIQISNKNTLEVVNILIKNFDHLKTSRTRVDYSEGCYVINEYDLLEKIEIINMKFDFKKIAKLKVFLISLLDNYFQTYKKIGSISKVINIVSLFGNIMKTPPNFILNLVFENIQNIEEVNNFADLCDVEVYEKEYSDFIKGDKFYKKVYTLMNKERNLLSSSNDLYLFSEFLKEFEKLDDNYNYMFQFDIDATIEHMKGVVKGEIEYLYEIKELLELATELEVFEVDNNFSFSEEINEINEKIESIKNESIEDLEEYNRIVNEREEQDEEEDKEIKKELSEDLEIKNKVNRSNIEDMFESLIK